MLKILALGLTMSSMGYESGTLEAVDTIVGMSDWAHTLRRQISTVAPHASSVLITGASGTGKELVARAIHAQSARSACPFIPVDCAAITGTLFASHMFGHLKGAFTGANYAAIGCFRAAEGGTIFLDEIGELDAELQAKLLRVLQERSVVPVGSIKEVSVDVRVIAATNRDLAQEVEAGRFREDLFYRLNVVAIRTAPLCERPDDIPLLIAHILAGLSMRHGLPPKTLSADALELLRSSPWPGNVRQLENVLERMVVFAAEDVVDRSALVSLFSESPRAAHTAAAASQGRNGEAEQNSDGFAQVEGRFGQAAPSGSLPAWKTMAEVEREHIRLTLEHTFGNQTAAAELLEMDRNLLRRKMVRYGIQIPGTRPGRPPKHERPR